MSGSVDGNAKDTKATAPAPAATITAPKATALTPAVPITAAAVRTAVASARVCSALVAARQHAARMHKQTWHEAFPQCLTWLAEVNGLLHPLLQSCRASAGAHALAVFPHIAVSAADVDSTRWYGAAALCVDLNADPHPLCVWARVMCDPDFPRVPGTTPSGDYNSYVPFVRESVRSDCVDPFPCDTLLSQVLELLYRTGAREWMLNAHNRKSVLATLSGQSEYGRARALLRLSMAAERYGIPCDAEWVTACRDALAELMATYKAAEVAAECRAFVLHAPLEVVLLDAPLPPVPQNIQALGVSNLLSLAVVCGHTDLLRLMLQRAPTAVLLFRALTTTKKATRLGPAAFAAMAEMDVARPIVLAQRRDAIAAALTREHQPPAAPTAVALAGTLPARESGESRDSDAVVASEPASPYAAAAVLVGLLPREPMTLLLAYVGDSP